MDAMEALVTAGGWLAAGVLILGGVAKLPEPDGAMATLHRLHLPSGRVAARLLGLGEIVTGLAVIGVGSRPAAAVLAVVYAAFTGLAAWQRAAQLDCGCFGTSATAVSARHVATNATFALVGLVGLAVPPATLAAVAADAGALATVAGAVLLVTGTMLVRVMLGRAAETAAAGGLAR